MKIKTGVITISDSSSKGIRDDQSGELIIELLNKKVFDITQYKIIPDDLKTIIKMLKNFSDKKDIQLILTTGGTGLSDRDVTPEATGMVIDKKVPGISEYIRMISFEKTNRAILSRGISGIRKKTLIINLPGSPKAVSEILEKITDPVIHGVNVMLGRERG